MWVVGHVAAVCAAVGPGYLTGANAQTIHFNLRGERSERGPLYVSLDFGAAEVRSWPVGTERRLVPAQPANITEEQAVWTSGPALLSETYTLDLTTGELTNVVDNLNGDARMCRKTSRPR